MADILVVDDDDVIRDTLYELLSTDYSCQTASTAEEALAKLEAQRFDVVLTDISMPGLDGKELLEKVLNEMSRAEIINMGVIWCPSPRFYPISLERFIASVLDREFR